jgi:hypothetical protein
MILFTQALVAAELRLQSDREIPKSEIYFTNCTLTYSDPEREILKKGFPQQSRRPSAVQILWVQLRMKFSAGSIEWPASREASRCYE